MVLQVLLALLEHLTHGCFVLHVPLVSVSSQLVELELPLIHVLQVPELRVFSIKSDLVELVED